jgi:paraquat-inducible protein B
VSKKANPTVIGAFVVGAVVLLVIAVVALGGGKFLEQTTPVAMCFEESLKGLQVGAPIMWEGVRVGEVTGIQLVVKAKEGEISSIVYGQIKRDNLKGIEEQPWGMRWRKRKAFENLQALVDEGMRARLDALSLVTGQLYIAVGLHPDQPATLTGANPGYFEIPTIPSLKGQLLNTIDSLPLKQISESVMNTAQAIDKLANDPEIGEALASAKDGLAAVSDAARTIDEELSPLITDLRRLIEDVDAQVKPLSQDLRETAADARRLINNVDEQVEPLATQVRDALTRTEEAIANADAALAHAAQATAENSELRVEVGRALKNLAAAARSAEALADYIERHPEALLRGKGGD